LTLLAHLYQSLSHANLATALLQSPSTTAFTADSLLSQLLLARSQLATGPTAKYTEAGYVFEEIKGMQGGRGESVLSGVLVSEGLRGAWDEADAAGRESREAYPKDPTTLANVIALALHTGKSSTVEASLACVPPSSIHVYR
jgi:coatomer protein complex subunit epsilon